MAFVRLSYSHLWVLEEVLKPTMMMMMMMMTLIPSLMDMILK